MLDIIRPPTIVRRCPPVSVLRFASQITILFKTVYLNWGPNKVDACARFASQITILFKTVYLNLGPNKVDACAQIFLFQLVRAFDLLPDLTCRWDRHPARQIDFARDFQPDRSTSLVIPRWARLTVQMLHTVGTVQMLHMVEMLQMLHMVR